METFINTKKRFRKKVSLTFRQTPLLIGEKIILITGDQKIIALNGKDGSLLWELLPLFQPTEVYLLIAKMILIIYFYLFQEKFTK